MIVYIHDRNRFTNNNIPSTCKIFYNRQVCWLPQRKGEMLDRVGTFATDKQRPLSTNCCWFGTATTCCFRVRSISCISNTHLSLKSNLCFWFFPHIGSEKHIVPDYWCVATLEDEQSTTSDIDPVVVRNTAFLTTSVVSPLRTSSPPPVISTSGSEKHKVSDYWCGVTLED